MPLTDIDIDFVFTGTPGVALAWVIGEDVVYDLPVSQEHSEVFLNANEVVDISEQYPDHDGVTVSLRKDGEELMQLSTTEYFAAVLQSNPLVLKLADYAYGRYVSAPHAKFDGEKFIVLDRDVTGLWPWGSGHHDSMGTV